MPTQVILLERVEKLGQMGEVVSVKPGYARNYLLPQKKALRASKDNLAYFEARKKHLEADNAQRRKEGEGLAKKIEGAKAVLIRQASEGGQLYGSVTARDIATAVTAKTGVEIARQMVALNTNFKMLGLFPVTIALHPEVRVTVTINIARSADEAEIQAKTGKALIAEDRREEEEASQALAPEAVLEDSVLAAKAQEDSDTQDEGAQTSKKAARKKSKADEA